MTASKYAVSITLNERDVIEHPEYLEHMKDKMRGSLGVNIFRIMEEEIKKPTTVKLTWLEQPFLDFDNIRIALVAHLFPTDTVYLTGPADVSWLYQTRSLDERLPVEWQCLYCGQVNLVKEHLECRKCGAPRKLLR